VMVARKSWAEIRTAVPTNKKRLHMNLKTDRIGEPPTSIIEA
jgi:hypothetical protein